MKVCTATCRREEPPDLAMLRRVIDALRPGWRVRVVANGGVRGPADVDVEAVLEATGADGVMSSEWLLDEPAVFRPAASSYPGDDAVL